ncbi:hypothetical protein T11_3382 [Trichinella zimbabwensis]|uniref:Uncharacterized protein n=1 Tax=Trichinella zimbabwensis TaxID=268475 RepID=A0A0V1G3S2_9BILA|nr:hypothetical protein T11_3382 [Trichinella zimbabwensis]
MLSYCNTLLYYQIGFSNCADFALRSGGRRLN